MTAYKPADWNRAFAAWTETHPEEEKALRKRIGGKPVRDYETGRINKLDKINPYRRALLYKATGIDAFNFEGYTNPDTLLVSSIANGTQPRAALPIWLGRHNIGKEELAKVAGVDTRVVYSFIHGTPIRDAGEEKVLKALQDYCTKYESTLPASPLQAPLPVPPVWVQPMRASARGLDELAQRASELTEAVRSLGGTIELDSSAWRARGTYAIGLLAEVMGHYASSKPEERRAFVDEVKGQDLLATFGWCGNVFSGLLKDDGSPDVFARHFRPHGRKKE